MNLLSRLNANLCYYISDPPVWKEETSKNHASELSSNITLTCDVCANPMPDRFEWKHNSVEINANGNQLALNNLQMEQFGTYTCFVTNRINTIEETRSFEIMLKVRGPPETPTELSVTSTTSISVTLTWLPGFNGGYEDTTLSLRYRRQGSTSSWAVVDDLAGDLESYTLSTLDRNTQYEFRLFSTNSHNGGSDSGTVKVTAQTTGKNMIYMKPFMTIS